MNRLILASLMVGLIACNNNTDTNDGAVNTNDTANQSTPADSGWVTLFDGTSTNQWHSYGKTTVGEAWKVENGELRLDDSVKVGGKIKNGGDLVTNDTYENFHLKLEWKISPKGNSGIMFLVQEDTVKWKEPYRTGPEMQILDNAGHSDAAIPKHRAGDLYDLIAVNKETVKPVGEWNQVEIILNNKKLDFKLNGENVVSTIVGDENWNKIVAGSKFKDWPDFGKATSGKIALQDHDNEVSFGTL